MATDEELLGGWRAGDSASGEAFIRRMFEPVRRFFASKAGAEVEELAQQTFSRVVSAQARFEGRSSARTFVFGVARNVLREHYRRRHRSDLDVEEIAVRDLATGPSTLRWRREEDARLLEALRGLPMHMQIVLELFYWDDFTAREIGEILDVPEGTVASRLGRAKKRLREELQQPNFAGPRSPDEPTLEAWADRIRDAVPLPERDA